MKRGTSASTGSLLLFQKVLIDEKSCYLFGRNPNLCDISIDHSSCSRIHAALVYHKLLERFFLLDLGSTHGTFVGSIRLEANKPTQLPIDSEFHFGASTRRYILREKPVTSRGATKQSDGSDETTEQETQLPDSECDLDYLTEYNTVSNKRLTLINNNVTEPKPASHRKRKMLSVSFKEEEEVINPEDIDPSVGRFQNLIHTSIIPNKQSSRSQNLESGHNFRILRPDHSEYSHQMTTNPLHFDPTSLGIGPLNPAPDVSERPVSSPSPGHSSDGLEGRPSDSPPTKKKKYAKESWPGRNPSLF